MHQKLDVIFEDNHLLVINKPALLPTMGVERGRDNLLAIAKNYLKKKYDKPGNVYLGVVSRLDSFVSGVVVFARTSKSAARLNQQFASSQPEKKYLAIVSSGLKEFGELEHWLTKDEANHRMMTVNENATPAAKQARLQYQIVGEFENLSLLEVKLLTGRKHQIRVQLSTSGHPIVGDKKYGSSIPFKSGIALHSRSLTIEHPTTKEILNFSIDPPDWWKLERFFD